MFEQIKQLVVAPLGGLADLLLPPACPLCDALLDSAGERVCPECADGFEPLQPPVCPRCGQPTTTNEVCPDCRLYPPPFAVLRSLYPFAGAVKEAVLRLKFGRKARISALIADQLMAAADTRLIAASCDLLIAVPLHRSRLRERGFNQAALIARRLSRQLQVPVDLSHLRRIRATPAQALTQSRQERLKNIQGAFRVSPDHPFRGKKVCLIDDVVTTGATLRSSAQSLLTAGAKEVRAVTFARSLMG
jgi:ComF family protein